MFERTPSEAFTIYTVVGIGKGFEVQLDSVPQTIAFTLLEGTKVSTNRNFTFGYINAIVNSGGLPVLTSPGTVDFDDSPDSGEGVGGAGTTNDWGAIASSPSPVVALGTTFGASGSGADYTFFGSYRTYSAQAVGILVSHSEDPSLSW